MGKIRVLIFLLTISVVGSLGLLTSFYARGYRINFSKLKFEPNGILVIKSDPSGAQIFVNGNFQTGTDATISLSPGIYDIDVKKDGYFPWHKRLSIEKEVVTQANVLLFKVVPAFSPVTFSGVFNPVASLDLTKIAYSIYQSETVGGEKAGLWVMDTFNLPLGFTREPRRITDGDLKGATYEFSPNGGQMLVSFPNGTFLLDTGSFVSQAQRVNVASKKAQILSDWEKEKKIKLDSQVRAVPNEVADILTRKAKSVVFSPDENLVLYTASASAQIPDNLIPQLPGSSTQRQDRGIKEDQTYVYDIKEDRNFLILDRKANVAIRWFPTSRHLILAEEGKITIMEYDGTNRQTVYSGSYVSPHAFPSANTGRLLLLTNLGADSASPNLYSLNLK